MILTLSIGLVSVNSPLSVKAQNNAISQNGGGAAEQEIKQGQSSTQNNRIISGDSSILSGNNLLCQAMEHSVVPSLCSADGLSEPPPTSPNQDRAPLHITVTTTTTPLCGTGDPPCPQYVVLINVLDENRQNVNAVASWVIGREQFTVDTPIGAYELYTVPLRAPLWDFPQITYSGDCVQNQSDPQFCKGSMSEQGGHVNINFHFIEPT